MLYLKGTTYALKVHKSVHAALGRSLVDRGVSALRFFTFEGLSNEGELSSSISSLSHLWTRVLQHITTTTSSILSFYQREENHDDLEQLVILADEACTAVLDTLAELAGSLDLELGIAVQSSRSAIEKRSRFLTRLLLGIRRELACLALLSCCFVLLSFMYTTRRRRRVGNDRR